MDAQIERYWQAYLDTLPPGGAASRELPDAERFGDTPAMADELGALVAGGTKIATCSCLWEWEADGQPLPRVGDRTVVLDGRDAPLCVIELTEVTVRAYEDVDEQFARDEGEGDRSLAGWRAAHGRWFARVLAKVGREPTADMPLVCERFRVVHR